VLSLLNYRHGVPPAEGGSDVGTIMRVRKGLRKGIIRRR
jgi:hypothetical protein